MSLAEDSIYKQCLPPPNIAGVPGGGSNPQPWAQHASVPPTELRSPVYMLNLGKGEYTNFCNVLHFSSTEAF